MKVFVIGGTGFLGTHLIPKLQKQGYEVIILTRSREKASDLESLGSKVVVGDLLQPESFMSALSPQDVVISVATPDIRPGRISPKRFKILRNQTIFYFSTPIAIAEKLSCPSIVTSGTSFRTAGEEVADESWPIERFGMTKIGELVDPLISEVIRRGSPPLIQMLPGEIYGPGGLFRNFMYEWMKKGRYRVIGSGENYIPRICVEDCAQAYVEVLKKMPLGESFIIADDGPCTQREFSDFMADCMNVSKPKSVPGFIIRIVMGKLIFETVTMNCRVSNAKAKEYLGWKLKFPTYREGLPVTISDIENRAVQMQAHS
ncbi:NAD-dependent epimerase/dehydratase family protein [Chloroflexota bacterium]